jgi:hypothetical protein
MENSVDGKLKVSALTPTPSTTAYYQDQLKMFWTGVSNLYEYDTIHSVNRLCCPRILHSSNDTAKRLKMGRKPGGQNKK